MSIQQVMMYASNVIPDGSNNFSGTTSWTVPDNVTAINILCIGAGAGGGGGGVCLYSAVGVAGGGGAYANNVAVTPGPTYNIIIGHNN